MMKGAMNKKSNNSNANLTLAPNTPDTFPIVGVGASAGGLESFSLLLGELPHDTGMAFVLIQHLDPTHSSFLSEALSKTTKMPVTEIKDAMKIQPNHVYVIPPNSDIGILNRTFTLFSRSKDSPRPHMAIDFFFDALATDCGNQSVGVVLSGTATDGTEGLRTIKAENGVTFAQDPKTAKFDGMPLSAIKAEVVDFCLTIPQIASELTRLARHPYLLGRVLEPLSDPKDSQDLQKVFVLIRSTVGINFSEYKPPTIRRRIARRMTLLKVGNLLKYIKFLKESPDEVRALAADILIHVTSFFRDPEAFKNLSEKVFPEIVKNKPSGSPIRIWVTGCSTGQEVYSIAITLLEFLGENSTRYPIQIFGSDISEAMIEKARISFYSEGAVRDIDAERLRRFFVKVQGGYRISKLIRDLCIFVRHDLARDPPFSKLDLVTCRNVLIYFEPELQKKIIATFHYCLNQPGFLFLGRTENLSGHSHFFSQISKASKIFSREDVSSPLRFLSPSHSSPIEKRVEPVLVETGRSVIDMGKQFDNFLLSQFAPAGVAVNERMEILQFRGETSTYLEQPSGQPQLNLLKMVREGLFAPLKVVIGEAKRKMTVIRKENIEFTQKGVRKNCNIIVAPISRFPDSTETYFLVMFEDRDLQPEAKDTGKPLLTKKGKLKKEQTVHRAAKLEHELRSTQEYLQAVSEENQKTNDALNSVNEELVSGNEELQSMNEELETAKEELQSTNEELTTVNDELQSRNVEAGQTNDDLINLLNSVEIPIVILDLNRHVRRFTSKARKLMNLLPTDIGRSIEDIKFNIVIENLEEKIQEVIDTALVKESEVQDQEGQWYRLQIRPYKAADNRIVGTVLSLIDINKLRVLLDETQQAKDISDKANAAKDIFLATLSHELRTPLASLNMQSHMLSRGSFDEKVKKAATAIESSAKKQSQLIEDLLDVSRIVTGKLKVELHQTDFRNIIQDSIVETGALAAAKSITIESNLDSFFAPVLGDSVRLQQVVSNLLTNAIKFTSNGGHVVVSLKILDGFAELKVIDTGIGISPEFLPQIFNRFTQEDATKTRKQGGLGLGLAIVRHIVELHKGTVRAESAGKNKGAVFTVVIPLIKGISEGNFTTVPARAVSKNQVAPNLQGLRVLLVDDDLACREALVEILGQAGAEVRSAESATDAIKVLEDFHPTEIICDIAMPGEDGYSLIRRIRKLESLKGRNIPAIALTAFASEIDHEHALLAGFQMHISKPFSVEKLTDALLELHQQSQLLAGGEK
jgi:two-component system, chemotaxis family, CheB/CheR fusion protein